MERGEIAPEEQFLLSSTIFCYLMLDLYVITRIRFSLRDKRLFEITEVEITRVDCIFTLPYQILLKHHNNSKNNYWVCPKIEKFGFTRQLFVKNI